MLKKFSILTMTLYLISCGGSDDSGKSDYSARHSTEALMIMTADLRGLSYRLTDLSRDATGGDERAFRKLQKVVTDMDHIWTNLQINDPHSQDVLSKPYDKKADDIWKHIKVNSQIILDNKETIIYLHDYANTLNEALPELHYEYANIVDILLENNAQAEQVSVAQSQSWYLERIIRNVDIMLVGRYSAERLADQFNIDTNILGRTLKGMINGDLGMGISRVTDQEARISLEEIAELFDFVSTAIKEISEASLALSKARNATKSILENRPLIIEYLSSVNEDIAGSATNQNYLIMTADLRAQSYRLTSLSRDAASGDEWAFRELKNLIASMDRTRSNLQSSNSAEGILSAQLAELDRICKRIKANAQIILDNKETIIFLHDVANTLNDSLPELQTEHSNIVDILLDNNGPAAQVSVAQSQSWYAERIGRNVAKMLAGGNGAMNSVDQFNIDTNVFGRTLNGMINGDIGMGISRVTDQEARAGLEEITELFDFVRQSIKEIYDAAPVLSKAQEANQDIIEDIPRIAESISRLSEDIAARPVSLRELLMENLKGLLKNDR